MNMLSAIIGFILGMLVSGIAHRNVKKEDELLAKHLSRGRKKKDEVLGI